MEAAQIRAPPLIPQYDNIVMYEMIQRSIQLGLNDVERRQSLGQLYVWSLLFFQTGLRMVGKWNE